MFIFDNFVWFHYIVWVFVTGGAMALTYTPITRKINDWNYEVSTVMQFIFIFIICTIIGFLAALYLTI